MLNWYLQSGKESDVVLSSRVRFARNIEGYPFTTKDTLEDGKKIVDLLKEITPSIGYGIEFFKLSDMDDITKLSLVEKHILSPDFAFNKGEVGAILINKEENICVMINEEDHIRIQVFAPGLDLENACNLAIEVDEKIGNLVDYACSKQYGFLTACPTNVGTGMRASVMVHLPALALTGNIGKVLEVVNGFGMNIRGIYGEGSQSQGNVYQVSNKQSLGISEQDIIKNIRIITDKIMEQERLARKYLTKNPMELEDRVLRSYGIVKYCKKIDSEEFRRLFSDIRLGTDLGILKELTDLKVNQMELYAKPANLQKRLGRTLSASERDGQRANIIKQIIEEEVR